jgi:hypothetical protein
LILIKSLADTSTLALTEFVMSVKSRSRKGRQIPEWLKDRGILLVTLTGVILYFFLSVPAAIFYAQFGVSAGEVGISYASLLSGSTVEIFLVIVILAGALAAAAYVIAIIGGVLFSLFIYFPYMFFRSGFLMFRDSEKLDDRQFERFLASYLRIYGQFPWFLSSMEIGHLNKLRSSAAVEREMRHTRELRKRRRELLTQLRELRKRGVSTAIVSAQLELIDSQIYNREGMLAGLIGPLFAIKGAIQRWGGVLTIGFASVILVVLLPVLAILQAGEVHDGKTYFGKNIGAFDYHADLVLVTPSSDNPAPSIQALREEALFLLGENAQYAVLYSPSNHSTIRVPISSVVIRSVG